MSPLRAAKLFSTPDLIPQFESLAGLAVSETVVLLELLRHDTDIGAQVQRAKQIEHEADEIVHQIVRDLTATCNSRFEREDLHQFASSLDDVIDLSYGAADRVLLYKIDQVPPAALEIAKVIHRQAEELLAAVSSLNSRNVVFQHCMVVGQLGYDADRLTSIAIAKLFEVERNAIQLIKLKELYSQLTSATDRAKTAAQALETMVLKRGPA